jgi:hypothetical protein
MPRYRRYRLAKLQVAAMGERRASWTFTREPVSGTELTYAVVDANSANRNFWEFLVRVPSAGDERIEVRPRATPSLKAWIGLERRSLTFARATRAGYRGWYYCQIALADPTGERTKDVLKKQERGLLPSWFDDFGSRLRVKETVRSTRGHDADQLVAVVRPSEHALMIGLFFATKVWVLKERVVLAQAG